MSRRELPALAAAAVIAALILLAGPADWLRGPYLDGLLLLRTQLFDLPRRSESQIAIVALDEETYRRPPFRGTPKVLWTPEIGQVLAAVLKSGASVVGFDLILPTSAEVRLPGHDHPLLLALRQGAKDNRVVLARVQHQSGPISPFPGHTVAVGRGRNIRLVNVFTDPDGVVRRVPLWFRVIGPKTSVLEPSFALEIAARHLDVVPERSERDHTKLGGRAVGGAAESDGLLLNFRAGASNFPIHSLADLHACSGRERDAFFHRHFAGRVVLFGTVLDSEDRVLTSKRFIGGSERDRWAPRCVHPFMEELFLTDRHRQRIPGVIVQATAIDNLVRNEGLVGSGRVPEFVLVVLLAVVCAWAFQRFPIGWSAAGLLAFGTAWTIAAAFILRHGIVLPGLTLAAALIAAAAVSVAQRYLVTDKDKRAIRSYFSLYLSPTVVDRMLATGQRPALGGERREVTVLVSDIAGYTTMSERMPPERMVDLLNRYLTSAATAVERHGGFVDKFMGDGMLAVFGAPLADPDHARHAVAAARELLRLTGTDPELVGGAPFRTRIGIATGPVVIGNVGSEKRLNYTVIGDTVNLAARLEGENKRHGTSILVSEETARLAGLDSFDLVDRVTVRGRVADVAVYTPIESPPRKPSHSES